MFCPKSHKKIRALIRTSYLGLQIWILLAPIEASFFVTLPWTPQCPHSHGTKPIRQLKCRGLPIHPKGSLYSQDLELSHVSGAWISHWLGKCLPCPCTKCTPLVMAWEYLQHVYNPRLCFRLQELPQPEDQPLL